MKNEVFTQIPGQVNYLLSKATRFAIIPDEVIQLQSTPTAPFNSSNIKLSRLEACFWLAADEPK